MHKTLSLFCFLIGGLVYGREDSLFIRVNQVGYLPLEKKTAIAFAQHQPRQRTFDIIDAESGRRIWGPAPVGKTKGGYGRFAYHYELDFSLLQQPGRYCLRFGSGRSLAFSIAPSIYKRTPAILLEYLRQQRCGYNPWLDQVCHRGDGRTLYGPMPDSTYIDVSGGWHDAGDHLRYLLTSGNTVCRLLFSYIENKSTFVDQFDYFGHPPANGIPDVLDEAKWGLDWMLKMHPQPQQLFHQVADDRDHLYFELPYSDSTDYGWGKGRYRPVYYATGKPQGIGRYQNSSTGIANLAGRFAAAMAMAAEVWAEDLNDSGFAAQCLTAGKEVYEMGKQQPGCQEGTPCRAPYRYHECTWADDMEWGATELYRVTHDEGYLQDAKRFAVMAGTVSWFGADSARHYEFYPFTNLGHYRLYPLVEKAFADSLADYYRTELENVRRRAGANPYAIGHPFIWCSNNLAAALITQALLYKRMTSDERFQTLALATRDWLLGRNPWGVSQFVCIPESGGITPHYPHSLLAMKVNRPICGGLNDGPVYASIFNSLKGVTLQRPDPFAAFQSTKVVYHDDFWDYATNEPTLDGTAEALYWLSLWAK